MNHDDCDATVRAETLFSELRDKSDRERSEALESESPEVVELVLRRLRSGDANTDSSQLPTKALLPESPLLANSKTGVDSRESSNNGGDQKDTDQSLVAPRYELLDKLGSGGFGVVYSAYDNELKRKVAIKMVRAGREKQSDLLVEAQALAGLDHPNIVPVYDVGRVGEVVFLVTKLIPGRSLAVLQRKMDLPVKTAVKIVALVADAVHIAHLQGIVHRDIKPANILLTRDKVFLCDFGLALTEDRIRMEPETAGTLPYMSPEQARGESDCVDGRSDIYSLGVVLYELLAGRRPFSGTASALLEQIAHREVRPPRQIRDNIPAGLERICLKALANRVTDRFATALDFSTELLQWLRAQNELRMQSKPRREYPVFEAVFHPIGALSTVVQELVKHPFVFVFFLPSVFGVVGGAKGWSEAWIHLPTLMIIAMPILGAVIKFLTARFSSKQGRLFVTHGVISQSTHEFAIHDLRSVQLIQDSLGKRFGYASLQLLGDGVHERIDGIRNAENIRASLAPFLEEKKD